MIVPEGALGPFVGDRVRISVGRIGTVKRVFEIPALPLLYLVERDDGGESIHSFGQLAIVDNNKRMRSEGGVA